MGKRAQGVAYVNIGVVGLGYVGLTFSIVAAMKGHTVYGIDSSSEVQEALAQKRAHFYEPGLDDLLSHVMEDSLYLVSSFEEEAPKLDLFLISVGTPIDMGNRQPRFSHLEKAIDQILPHYDGSQLVILRSTVSVGTTRDMVVPMLEKGAGEAANGRAAGGDHPEAAQPAVAFCPERTVEGSAIKELQELPQIVGGLNEDSVERADAFFRSITPTVVRVESLEAAELVKLFNNTYRDIQFSIGNLFNEIAQSFGIDGIQAIRNANFGYPRSKIASPGFVGGPCLEKDSYILTHNLPSVSGKEFVLNARRYNESLHGRASDWIREQAEATNRRALLMGMAFKGEPPTGDLRGSSSVAIARELAGRGIEVVMHDFHAERQELEALGIGTLLEELDSAEGRFGVIAILTNTRRYRDLSNAQIDSLLLPEGRLLDVWGVLRDRYGLFGSEQIYRHIGNWELT